MKTLNLQPIPVAYPRLPSASSILPYLKQIDANRWYSNQGEMVKNLQQKLIGRFLGSTGNVLATSSGSAGLIGAILGSSGRATPEKPLCICPSFTFVATAASAVQCGFTPYFVDVDPNTWAMSPADLMQHPMLAKAGAIIVVAPFGRVPDLPGWQRFSDETGIPVVIDAAAAFDTLRVPPNFRLPIVLSFHATKVLGSGEGGAIMLGETAKAEQYFAALNHGLSDGRVANSLGTNGKMSEYQAALVLAGLEGWAERHLANSRISQNYQQKIPSIVVSPKISAAYALLECENAQHLAMVQARLTNSRVGSRKWYGNGVHNEPAFSHFPGDAMPNTKAISERLLGLPSYCDLAPSEIDRIADALLGA